VVEDSVCAFGEQLRGAVGGAADRDGLGRSNRPFVLNGVAAALAAARRFEQSAAYAAQAADLFRDSGDCSGEAAALSNQGLAIARAGDPIAAITYFTKALEIFESIDSAMGSAIQHANIGSAHLDLGHLDESADQFESCIALSREGGLRFTEGKALANLADVEHRRGRMAAARTRAQEALELTRATGNRLDEALALGILGLVLEHDGDPTRAVPLWKLSSEIPEQIGEPQTAQIARLLSDTDGRAASDG
jgi:tetratricopeptide (TPR) repeat protein